MPVCRDATDSQDSRERKDSLDSPVFLELLEMLFPDPWDLLDCRDLKENLDFLASRE